MVFLNVVGRFEILDPTGNEPLSAYYRKNAPSQIEKRQMVGGPSAAPSGGMSDVRSLEQDDHSLHGAARKDN
jgi:hypothetical protein